MELLSKIKKSHDDIKIQIDVELEILDYLYGLKKKYNDFINLKNKLVNEKVIENKTIKQNTKINEKICLVKANIKKLIEKEKNIESDLISVTNMKNQIEIKVKEEMLQKNTPPPPQVIYVKCSCTQKHRKPHRRFHRRSRYCSYR